MPEVGDVVATTALSCIVKGVRVYRCGILICVLMALRSALVSSPIQAGAAADEAGTADPATMEALQGPADATTTAAASAASTSTPVESSTRLAAAAAAAEERLTATPLGAGTAAAADTALAASKERPLVAGTAAAADAAKTAADSALAASKAAADSALAASKERRSSTPLGAATVAVGDAATTAAKNAATASKERQSLRLGVDSRGRPLGALVTRAQVSEQHPRLLAAPICLLLPLATTWPDPLTKVSASDCLLPHPLVAGSHSPHPCPRTSDCQSDQV